MKTKKIILLFLVSMMFTVSYSQITVKMPKIGFGKKEKTSNEVAQKTQTPEEKKAQDEKEAQEKKQRLANDKEEFLKKLENSYAPKDEYMGSDKDLIKTKMTEQWNSECKSYKILSISLEESWERKKGYNDNMQEYDYNSLDFVIFVQNPDYPEVADLYCSYVWKNNLSENSKKIDYLNAYCGYNMKRGSILVKNIGKAKG